jgi:hypothetical protein
MEDNELAGIDKLVCDLRRVSAGVCLKSDAEFAATACLQIDKACRLINKLTQDNLNLKFDVEQQKENK